MKGPQFLQYCIPIIEVLRSLGNSGTPSEVTDFVIEKMNISEEEQSKTLKNGQSKVRNRIAWARFYLTKGGLLEGAERGVWSLSDKGKTIQLSETVILDMFKSVQGRFQQDAKQRKSPGNNLSEATSEEEDIDSLQGAGYKDDLLNIIRSLPPEGFERLCQRLLRESGFTQVFITGRSGDEGIDGNGILQINQLVSFKVLFQCKRYKGSVGPSQVRDFRGAMQGRADKGIIMTTGSFTTEAKKEAQREGVPPIELVDGDKLVEMFEKLELGLLPQKTYEINTGFFEEFSKK